MVSGARAAALVSQMTVATVVCGLLGHFADTRFGTEPWLAVAGFVTGFSVGMTSMLIGLLGTTHDDDPPDPPQ
jgi:F0F1-type ATP synthase assembly protein I